MLQILIHYYLRATKKTWARETTLSTHHRGTIGKSTCHPTASFYILVTLFPSTNVREILESFHTGDEKENSEEIILSSHYIMKVTQPCFLKKNTRRLKKVNNIF